MKLLIVTPTRGDRLDLLDAVLKSIDGITVPYQHIIVAPVEKHPAIRSLMSDHPILLVCETGRGMYAAINQGIDAAAGGWDWFTYINDDDYFSLHFDVFLNRIIASESCGCQADVYYGRVAMVGADSNLLYHMPVCPWPQSLLKYWAIGKSPLTQQGVCVARRVVESLKGFNNNYIYAADMDFFCRALSMGFNFKYLPIVVAAFRLHGGQLSKHRIAFNVEISAISSRLMRVGVLHAIFIKFIFYFWNIRVYFYRFFRLGLRRYDDIINNSQ